MAIRNIFLQIGRSSLILNLTSIVSCRIVNNMIALITFGYAARVLGAEMFGIVGFGASVAAYAGIMTLPGITIWGTRTIATDRANMGKTFLIVNSTILLLACLAFCFLILFSLTLDSPVEKKIVLLSGLTLFSTALSLEWVFNGLEQMRIPAMLSILGTSVYTVTLLTLVKSPTDVYIFPLLMPGSLILVAFVSFFVFIKYFPAHFSRPKWSDYRKALSGAAVLGLMASIVIILHFANNLIVKAYLGAFSLGIFLAAFKIVELLSSIPAVLASIFFARLARYVADNRAAAQKQAGIYAHIHMIMAFFIAAYMVAEAPEIIHFIYGEKYAGSVIILQIMSIAVIFNFAIYGYTNCLVSFSQDRTMLLVVIVSAAISIVGGIIFVPWLGVIGAAIAISLIDLSGWLASTPTYRNMIGSLRLRLWIKPALGFMGMIGILFFLQKINWPLYLRIPIAAILYLAWMNTEIKSVLRSIMEPGVVA